MGTGVGEEPLLSSQENPRALCQLRKTVSPCQGALAARAASQSCSKPSPPCCGPRQAAGSLWKEAEIFLLLRKRLGAQNFRADFGEWTFDTETQTDRGLLKATQQGQVSQGLTLHIWLKSLQHFSYPRAVNSWRGRPLFEYLLLGRVQAGLQMSVWKHKGQMLRGGTSAGTGRAGLY